MRQGKLTTDVIVKAGEVFGSAADKQGTLAVALQQSSAQQTRFNNRLKEMSLIILRSGLDEFLAKLFHLGSEVIPYVTEAFRFLFKTLKSIYSILKALAQFVQNHPLISGVAAAAIVYLATVLMLATGRAALLLGVFANMIAVVTRLGAAIKWLMSAALLGGLIYLLSDIENYFVLGNKDGILGDWERFFTNFVELTDLYLSRARVLWMEFLMGVNPFDGTQLTIEGVQKDRAMKDAYRKSPMYLPDNTSSDRLLDSLSPVWDFLESAFRGNPTTWMGKEIPPSQSVAPQRLEKPQTMNINLNIENMPSNVIERMNASDWQGFGRGVAQGIYVGGLGYNIS